MQHPEQLAIDNIYTFQKELKRTEQSLYRRLKSILEDSRFVEQLIQYFQIIFFWFYQDFFLQPFLSSPIYVVVPGIPRNLIPLATSKSQSKTIRLLTSIVNRWSLQNLAMSSLSFKLEHCQSLHCTWWLYYRRLNKKRESLPRQLQSNNSHLGRNHQQLHLPLQTKTRTVRRTRHPFSKLTKT